MASKITDQEKRNVWLSVYTGTITGLVSSTEEHDEESQEDNAELATAYADQGLDDFLIAFGETPVIEAEIVNDDEEQARPRRRRAR